MARIILCPGQGAQTVGMGKGWFDASGEAREVFALADRVLAGRLPGGARLSELCFAGPAEVLNRTDVSQPAIYATTIACWRALLARWGCSGAAEAGVAATAGLSLGEYSALCIAGVFDFEAGLNLVALRGRAMQDAAEATPSGMIALIGADEAQARAVCEQTLAGLGGGAGEVLVPANFNAPGQIVLSGSKGAVAAAEGVATGMGLRATVLQVAGAFHSPIMAPAAARLREALAATAMHAPGCLVVSNVTAQAHQAQGGASIDRTIRERLAEQLTAPVRWAQGCAWLAQGPGAGAEVIELAPGRTLAGLMRRIDKNVKVTSYDQPE
jgi:[acyl-carrier-protein] S-malonyltransferase